MQRRLPYAELQKNGGRISNIKYSPSDSIVAPLMLAICLKFFRDPGMPRRDCSAADVKPSSQSDIIEDRRVSLRCRVYPSIRLSQIEPSDHILRGGTIRVMLRPAVLASTPDWVKPASPASRLGTVSWQVQSRQRRDYHASPPSACISIRATDMITAFQMIRQ